MRASSLNVPGCIEKRASPPSHAARTRAPPPSTGASSEWWRRRGLALLRPGRPHRGEEAETGVSSKMIHAPCVGRFFYNGPTVSGPGSDGFVVALESFSRRTLARPAEALAKDHPRLGRRIANASQAFDHARDARQGPQLGGEAVRPGAVRERLLDLGELGVGELAEPPRTSCAGQGIDAATPKRAAHCDAVSRETPRERATSAWETSRSNIAPARIRRSSSAAKSRHGATRLGADSAVERGAGAIERVSHNYHECQGITKTSLVGTVGCWSVSGQRPLDNCALPRRPTALMPAMRS